jgi:predicted MPP superfamily phosphohydrolase
MMALAGCGMFRVAVGAVFLLFAVSFPAGRIFAGRMPEMFSRLTALLGSLYIAPMLYGFMFTLAADFFRLLNGVIAITHNPPPYPLGTRLSCVALIFSLSLMVTLAGAWNANSPVVVTHEVTFENAPPYADGFSLKIAVLSDIHLGPFTGPGYLKKLARITNGQFPDIVLLVGDTVDSEEFFEDERRTAEAVEALSSFRAGYGTWAVMGNHDYYAGADDVIRLYASSGVSLLRDEIAVLDGKFALAGRDDRASASYGVNRLGLAEILSAMPETGEGVRYPVILMDHQPFVLEEAMEGGIDLQVSGHTHRGQLWPINFIVGGMYEKSYGPYKKGGTNYYISSGAGVWGPPVRTIGRPEIVIINVRGAGGDYDKWKIR